MACSMALQNVVCISLLRLGEGIGYKHTCEISAWMELTKTPWSVREEIAAMMEAKLAGGQETGFQPYRKDGAVWFNQRWLLMLGHKGR